MNEDEVIQRDAFYADMKRQHGMSKSSVITVLKGAGYTTFNAFRIPEYTGCIAVFAKKADEQALTEKREKLRVKLMDTPEPESCPVCEEIGTRGFKELNRIWGWACTDFGIHHTIVWRTIPHVKDKPQFIATVTKEDKQKETSVSDTCEEKSETEMGT